MSLSIPEIVAAVAADFAARGITAEVLFGSWKPQLHNGANRVILGLADFASAPPGPPNAPGVPFVDTPNDTRGARSLFTRVQSVKVWVHAKPPADEKDAKRSEKAQEATAKLLHATLAAMYRYAHGSFGWGGGQWPSPEKQEFLYGSLATFVAQFHIPVLDDEHQAVTPDAAGSTTETSVVFPGGEEQDAMTP